MRRGVFIPAIFLLVVGSVFALAFVFRHELGRFLLVSAINRSTQAIFDGSVRVGKIHLDREFGIHIRDLKGHLVSERGPVPWEIQSIESQGPLTHFFTKEGVVLVFEGIRPRPSEHLGIRASARIRGGQKWEVELQMKVQGLGLDEIEWLSPENLSGAAGNLQGEVFFRMDAQGEIAIRAQLRVEEPGGRLQARFFDLLMPYLPGLITKGTVDEIIAQGGVVGFRKASFRMEVVESDKIKFFIQMAVPDYNLNLNVNLELTVDGENAFVELAELAGLFKGQSV